MKYFFSCRVIVLLMGSMLFFTSCSKSGAKGDQGATGPAGPVGPAGQDGSQIYAGNGVPASSQGNVGDYYLDQGADNLYGPKTSAGWGSPLSLKGSGPAGATGATGAAGKSGSQILSGSGVPAAGVGNTGDYFLDTTDYLLYGPKTATGWGGGLLLKGKDGNQFVNNYVFKNAVIPLPGGGGSIDFNVPAITANIISEGAILLYTDYDYGSVNGGKIPGWYPVPIISPNYLYITVGRIETGDVEVDVFFPEGTSMSSLTADFEIVVIQGSSVTDLSIAHPSVNLKDYNQVSTLFHLNE
jgi:hypothetical protein